MQSALRKPTMTYTPEFERGVYKRVTRRLIPFLFLCYIFAYLDRVNVGFAKLRMQQDLSMSDTAYGTAAGIFFLGYLCFQVPCNLVLQRIGAKRWLGPMMVVWGIVSACTMAVKTDTQFCAVRFVLGIVESGFFPGVILYLTFWYPSNRRAKIVAAFMAAIPLSGLLGGPLSGWLLGRMSSVGWLRGWQWLFLLEAVPSIIAGVVTMFFLADNPQKAKWLADHERSFLLERLHAEEAAKRCDGDAPDRLRDAFRSYRVWLLSLVYFGMLMGSYGIQFWLPQIVKDRITNDPWHIGLLTAIPFAVATLAMLLVGYHSDKKQERRWHVALVTFAGAAGLGISALPGIGGVASLLALTLAAAGLVSATSTFWSLPTGYLSRAAAPAGIACINSIGNLGGFVSPYAIGRIHDALHSMTMPLLVLAFCSLCSAVITLLFFKRTPAESTAHA